jgi:alanine racemase
VYTIKQITEIVDGEFFGTKDHECNAFLTDSRQLTQPAGTVFFALVSSRNDAHLYIEDLVKKGVRCFVVSDQNTITDKLLKAKVSFVLVKDALLSLQKLAAYHRDQFKIPVIGITGSNGKTIVKEWLYQLLKDDQAICRSPKSYNSQIGVPLSVLNLNKQHTLAIFEAGISLPNEMEKLQRIIQPTIGVFTSLGTAHDEGFKGQDQKLKEKLKLFLHTDTIVFNKFDSPSIKFNQSEQLITIGQSSDCSMQLLYKIIKNRTQLTLTKGNKKYSFSIKFIDKASVLNCCTCIAVMLHLGYDPKVIQVRIDGLESIALRLEVKKGIHNSILINDYYNSDLDSIKIALSFLNQQHRGEKKCLIISDIEQSGRIEAELYKELAVLVYQNKIDQLIGIGKAISNRASVFNPISLFYPDKDAFIKDLKNINSIFSNATILLKGAHSFKFDEISKHLQLKSHDTVLEINLNKLTHNVNHYRSLIEKNTQLMCMVKAMGYGSGSSEIAKTLQHVGVNYLAVAYADEGVELREANISLPIMVMSPERDSFEDIVKYNLEPEIYSFKLLSDFIKALDRMGVYEAYPIHLKIDTGMKRLGFEPDDMDELITKLKSNSQVRVKSIFSHLVASDNTALDAFTKQQISSFKNVSEKIEKAIGYSAIKHICNTGGISRFKQAHFDMVRLGIGMYGFGVNRKEQKQLENVSSLRTCISQIKRVKKNETIGYNRKGVAKKEMKIATIPIGYADGFHRVLGNGNFGVFIRGKFCNTIGNICMDMCMIDVTNIKCEEGDEVIVFDKADHVNELAVAMNSIPYEVLTNISSRVKRVYTQE